MITFLLVLILVVLLLSWLPAPAEGFPRDRGIVLLIVVLILVIVYFVGLKGHF